MGSQRAAHASEAGLPTVPAQSPCAVSPELRSRSYIGDQCPSSSCKTYKPSLSFDSVVIIVQLILTS